MTSTIATYTAYWREIVVKDYDDFASNEGDLRLAFHSAVTLFHMADWVFFGEERSVRQQFKVKSEDDFRAALCQHLREFDVIRDIANSAKHFKLKKGEVQKPKAKSIDPWRGSWGNSWGKSWTRTQVQIEGPDGNDGPFIDVALAVRQMWETLAADHGWVL